MGISTNSRAFQDWVDLARGYRQVRMRIDLAFKARNLPALEWYDVLLELERHGQPLRARDLERRLLLAQYNLSRLLDRMEQAGLIAREPDPDDGRGRLIRILTPGLVLRRDMWPVYQQAVEGRPEDQRAKQGDPA